MDSRFVPNLTIGPPVIESIRKRTRLPLDVHLMIEWVLEDLDLINELGLTPPAPAPALEQLAILPMRVCIGA